MIRTGSSICQPYSPVQPGGYRGLPRLSTLIGVEAAGRLQSFSRAAEELNITLTASSHQVRVLEEHLGRPLFRRIGQRIELIDAGRDFLITVQAAQEELRHGARHLNAYSKPGSVLIMMPAALAAGWFLPQLSELRRLHPSIDPWLHTSDETHIPEEAEIDVLLGPQPWADEGAGPSSWTMTGSCRSARHRWPLAFLICQIGRDRTQPPFCPSKSQPEKHGST